MTVIAPTHDLTALLDAALSRPRNKLAERELAFARRVFANGIQPYEHRLAQYSFLGHSRVLDAGCGFGQWSLALARYNQQVAAIDFSPARVEILRQLVEGLGIKNVETLCGSLDRLPFSSGSFDAVFCYGVIFLTPWKASLRELARVLAPNGRLYANANGLGWYKFLWYTAHNRGAGYEPQEVAGKVLLNTFRYHRGEPIDAGVDILIEPEELTRELHAHGLEIDELAPEGGANLRHFKGPTEPPFFIGEYRGDRGVYEILATKNKQR